MKLLDPTCLIALALMSVPYSSSLATQIVATRMGDTLDDAIAYLGTLTPPAECVFGHLETPVRSRWPVGGLDLNTYALKARPFVDCAHCTLGFQVHTIHLMAEVPLPTTFEGWVELMDPQFPIENCVTPVPILSGGGVDCEAAFTVDVPEAGFYDVAIPIECGCAVNAYPYFVSFSTAGTPPTLMDAACTSCAGWYVATHTVGYPWWESCDPVGTGGGQLGDVLYYVEASCCEQPVASQRTSWGALKSLFED
jgi:hypothetical protein